ncbi:MAG TPA: 3-oxoacyl-ACP reductase family protein [Terriglobales bacterium]|nr:3-oxoacyl-ACP reductase family protein [Terriglobales bacterium]
MDTLNGKTALVTGGNRGIGASISLALAKAGCNVAVNFRTHTDEAEKICTEISALGRKAIAVQADVSSSDQVKKMAERVERDLGMVNILINNAAMIRPQKIEEITEANWDEMMDVNLKSAFLVTQAFLPRMRKQQWGRIVNISSVAAQVGGLVGPHYAASKAGMLGLARSYASLLVKEGITVNSVCPALIDTEMVRSNPRANPALIPVGRFGNVEEVASVVMMLVGNAYMTGQTVNVNGGWYMS